MQRSLSKLPHLPRRCRKSRLSRLPNLHTGILQPNQDDDDERSSADRPARDNDDESLGANDDELVKLQLDFQPYGMDEGNLELKFDDSAIRVFTEDGTPLTREQLKVDLAAPQGPLADLKNKKMTVFLRRSDRRSVQ